MKKTFKCKYCGDNFTRNVFPSSFKKHTFEFCSPACRNKSRIKIQNETCPICKCEFYPSIVGGKIGNWQRKQYCSQECAGVDMGYFTDDEVELIKNFYPSKGWEWIAKKTGRDKNAIQNKAYNLGITLNDDIYQERVHEATREYMTENNHMKNPEIAAKVNAYWQEPENKKRMTQHLTKIRQKQQKTNITKLEKRLHEYLDKLNISYEPFAIIKKNFVVDIRIGDLIIEADGDYWHGHPRFEPLTDRQIKQQKRDAARNKYLTTCSYTVIRIWESDMTFELVKSILENHNII